ncbi:hypothetical protein VIGAN_07189100 [Vigna angularis var. angularis]|uniref:Uncharacterized protein n=1 Tax=Vigna angularis var. angularis TaxID=157739 RepID=A0A0S3SJH9_PHAAN|nr:hypothetical protein VIGAN_07189100 [Vigna angularis var. angularis]
MNAQKQKGQALNAASAQKAIDILKVQLQTLNNGNADGAKEDTNGIDPSDSTDVNKGQTVPVQEQAPVGLGKGLSSLDAKKQNAKPKAGA